LKIEARDREARSKTKKRIEMESITTFIPVLSISSGVSDIEFYKKAFGAVQLWRLNNPDGSVHVAAFSVEGAMFRLHEEGTKSLSPDKAGTTTVTVALTVDNVHAVIEQAVAAGAIVLSPVTDYEYGYRQAELMDPFGHRWTIEKLLSQEALDNFVKGASGL
jgi:PhnB protein